MLSADFRRNLSEAVIRSMWKKEQAVWEVRLELESLPLDVTTTSGLHLQNFLAGLEASDTSQHTLWTVP